MSEIRVNNLSNESDSGGPTISGITTFSSPYFFTPPVGNTAQRPENPEKGSIRFNTDSKHLEYFRGDTIGWSEVEASNEELNGSTRALAAGGHSGPNGPGYTNSIDYYAIDYPNDAIDFGDLTGSRGNGVGGASSRTRGLVMGGYNDGDQIDYLTIASTGNAVNFGNLAVWFEGGASCSSNTRAIMAGGFDRPSSSGSSAPKAMNYVTIASTGDGRDFGDLSTTAQYMGSFASTTRGFWLGGNSPSPSPGLINTIDYVTVSTTGNAADFGDLLTVSYAGQGCSNSTRGIMFIGMTPDTSTNSNTIEYLTMASTGNAVEFGDTITTCTSGQAASSPTRASVYSGTGGGILNWFVVNIATTGNAVEFGDVVNAGSSYGKYGGTGISNGHGGL